MSATPASSGARFPARVQIFSDLHTDVVARPVPTPPAGTDVVVVAGDTCQGAVEGFGLLRETIPREIDVVVVAGNHEFYRRNLRDEIDAARRHAPSFGITFLENDVATIRGLRFVGATLWTDYLLMGEALRTAAMDHALHGLNDHRRIRWQSEPWLRFRPQEAALLHSRSREFIATTIAQPFVGPTLVVTHHAPHPRSLAARYAQSGLNPAYASDLGPLILHGNPKVWIHGHIHTSNDYLIGTTRVISNPAGYGRENPQFDPGFTIEV